MLRGDGDREDFLEKLTYSFNQKRSLVATAPSTACNLKNYLCRASLLTLFFFGIFF
jgi:hypothetical protein